MNKVYGGTPLSCESLCKTCRAAQIMRGLAEGSERVICRATQWPLQISIPIAVCSNYDDKRQPSRWDMEQIAWVLVTNKAGKAIGFVSAGDFQRGMGAPTTPNTGFGT